MSPDSSSLFTDCIVVSVLAQMLLKHLAKDSDSRRSFVTSIPLPSAHTCRTSVKSTHDVESRQEHLAPTPWIGNQRFPFNLSPHMYLLRDTTVTAARHHISADGQPALLARRPISVTTRRRYVRATTGSYPRKLPVHDHHS